MDLMIFQGMFDSGLLEEHLRSYRAVMNFKDKVGKIISLSRRSYKT